MSGSSQLVRESFDPLVCIVCPCAGGAWVCVPASVMNVFGGGTSEQKIWVDGIS